MSVRIADTHTHTCESNGNSETNYNDIGLSYYLTNKQNTDDNSRWMCVLLFS